PLEKLTVTLPEIRGEPQSSRTTVLSATGQPAETWNESGSVGRAGWSFVAVQAPWEGCEPGNPRSAMGLEPPTPRPADPVTFTFTGITRPSLNWSVKGAE